MTARFSVDMVVADTGTARDLVDRRAVSTLGDLQARTGGRLRGLNNPPPDTPIADVAVTFTHGDGLGVVEYQPPPAGQSGQALPSLRAGDSASVMSKRLAIEQAYGAEVDLVCRRLRSGTSVLVRCDKLIAQLVADVIRSTEANRNFHHYDDPRLAEEFGAGGGGERRSDATRAIEQRQGITDRLASLRAIMPHLRADRDVLVFPDLDLRTTITESSLGEDTKELITLLYRNIEVPILGFVDPTFRVPPVVEDRFQLSVEISGTALDCVDRLLSATERGELAAEGIDSRTLFRYASGLNAVEFRMLVDSLMADKAEGRRGTDLVGTILEWKRDAHAVEVPDVDLDADIGGYPEVKAQVRELVRMFDVATDPDADADVRALVPRGLLLHGPPGTGKTFFARAIANSLGATLRVVNGPELRSVWVGQSEENVRRIFADARHTAPSIIVFDEFDSIAPRRSAESAGGAARVDNSIVATLLSELDGFAGRGSILVVATTNQPGLVDPALLRPGRIERMIYVGLPDAEARAQIVAIHTRPLVPALTPDLVQLLVQETEGFNNDQIRAVGVALRRRQVLDGAAFQADESQIRAAVGAVRQTESEVT